MEEEVEVEGRGGENWRRKKRAGEGRKAGGRGLGKGVNKRKGGGGLELFPFLRMIFRVEEKGRHLGRIGLEGG